MIQILSLRRKPLIIISVALLAVAIVGFGFIKSMAGNSVSSQTYLLKDQVKISMNLDSKWKNGQSDQGVIRYTLTNISSKDIKNWNMKIQFPKGVTIKQGWCSKYSMTSNTMTLTPMDYNTILSASQSMEAGFIINCENGLDLSSLTVSFNGQACIKSGSESTTTTKTPAITKAPTVAPFVTATSGVKTASVIATKEVKVTPSPVTKTPSVTVSPTKSAQDSGSSGNDRYFSQGLSGAELMAKSSQLSKKQVKQLMYDQIDEHWALLSKRLGQTDKKKMYCLFLGFATRESTLNAGLETAQEQGFGVNPAHAYGPLQTAVTAFLGCNPDFDPENDVPELYQYQWNQQNFYDPGISMHMGIRKLLHFMNEAESYNLNGTEALRNALKGFNTGHANPENNSQYYASYPDEIAAMAGWYYKNEHYQDDVFTWTGDSKVDRSSPWGWWK